MQLGTRERQRKLQTARTRTPEWNLIGTATHLTPFSASESDTRLPRSDFPRHSARLRLECAHARSQRSSHLLLLFSAKRDGAGISFSLSNSVCVLSDWTTRDRRMEIRFRARGCLRGKQSREDRGWRTSLIFRVRRCCEFHLYLSSIAPENKNGHALRGSPDSSRFLPNHPRREACHTSPSDCLRNLPCLV